MARLAPKKQPEPAPPLVRPRVEAHARDDRFTFIHHCGQAIRTTVLPLGPSSWAWDREAGTITPPIACQGCGLRGSWIEGRWMPL